MTLTRVVTVELEQMIGLERYLEAKLKGTWKQSLIGNEGDLKFFCAHL